MVANRTLEDAWPDPWWPEGLWPEVSFTPEGLKALGEQINKVRARGIGKVDLELYDQTRKLTPRLDYLANLYADLKGFGNAGRPDKIRRLLWDSLEKYNEQERVPESAAWVRALFFNPDDPELPVKPRAGIEKVMKDLGFQDWQRRTFDRRRYAAFLTFAGFLVEFVRSEAEEQNRKIEADRIKDRAEKERIEAERIKRELKKQKKAEKEKERIQEDQAKAERQERQLQLWREKRELELQEARDKAAKAPMRYASIVVLAVLVLLPLVALAQNQISAHQATISHAWSVVVEWWTRSS